MKKIVVFLAVFLLVCQTTDICGSKSERAEDLSLISKSAVLIDGDSGRILYGKKPFEKMAMASTTKIMTCIVALENSGKDDIFTVSENAEKMPRVRMNVKKGEQYRMTDLLYAMMLESYNDVAVVVAENVAGSTEKFAVLMNKKAKEIGAANTNFVTPNGLDAPKHYSTAYDMALIGAYAIKNADFLKIVGTPLYKFSDITGGRTLTVSNKDAFLAMDDGALGIKTGFTGKAGYCFVGALKNNGRLFVTCVLACGWPPNKNYKWKDTTVLMNFGKRRYRYKNILEKNAKFELSIDGGTKADILAEVKGQRRVLVCDNDKIEVKTDINYCFPIEKGDKVGSAEIYINKKLVDTYKIVSCEKAQKYDYTYCLRKLLNYWLNQTFNVGF